MWQNLHIRYIGILFTLKINGLLQGLKTSLSGDSFKICVPNGLQSTSTAFNFITLLFFSNSHFLYTQVFLGGQHNHNKWKLIVMNPEPLQNLVKHMNSESWDFIVLMLPQIPPVSCRHLLEGGVRWGMATCVLHALHGGKEKFAHDVSTVSHSNILFFTIKCLLIRTVSKMSTFILTSFVDLWGCYGAYMSQQCG